MLLRYCVGVARSTAGLMGPYIKAAAPVLSQFASDPSAKTRAFAGPGHCSVVRLPDANGKAQSSQFQSSTGLHRLLRISPSHYKNFEMMLTISGLSLPRSWPF